MAMDTGPVRVLTAVYAPGQRLSIPFSGPCAPRLQPSSESSASPLPRHPHAHLLGGRNSGTSTASITPLILAGTTERPESGFQSSVPWQQGTNVGEPLFQSHPKGSMVPARPEAPLYA